MVRSPLIGPCKLFIGTLDPKGYGRVSKHGQRRAHRAAWIDAYGPIPDGLYVLHHCDVRNCIEPLHLYLGTQVENMADMKTRDRANRPTGNKNGRAILTEDNVKDIRKSEASHSSLGRIYGVSHRTISAIRQRLLWKHVE